MLMWDSIPLVPDIFPADHIGAQTAQTMNQDGLGGFRLGPVDQPVQQAVVAGRREPELVAHSGVLLAAQPPLTVLEGQKGEIPLRERHAVSPRKYGRRADTSWPMSRSGIATAPAAMAAVRRASTTS